MTVPYSVRTTIIPPAPRGWHIDPAGVVLAFTTALTVLAFVIANSGCAWLQTTHPATLAGIATNTTTAALVAIESAQGDAEIAAGRDPESTVLPKWAPFWQAWGIWIAAQHAWADAVDRGDNSAGQAEAAARAALCAAQAALPPEVPREVVMVAGLACAVLPSAPAVLPIIARDAGAEGGDGG